jgi:hypothetical protein
MKKILFITTAAILISGCGDGTPTEVKNEVPDEPVITPKPVPVPENKAPTISGTPQSSLLTNTDYLFTPDASDGEDDPLTFSISNKPNWADFNIFTGVLKGTPIKVASFENIVISVSDGTSKTSLPAFNINALNPLHNVSITWEAPISNVKGDDIENITGYKIMYGKESENYDHLITINDPSKTNTLILDLERSNYYFSMKTITPNEVESKPAIEYVYVY